MTGRSETSSARLSSLDRKQVIDSIFDRLGDVPLDPGLKEALSADLLGHLRCREPAEAKIRVGFSPIGNLTIVETINDDAPLLVESVLEQLARHHLQPLVVRNVVLAVERDKDGELVSVDWSEKTSLPRESVIHIHLAPVSDPEIISRLREDLASTFADVQSSARDQGAMRDRISETIQILNGSPIGSSDERREAIKFLEWLLNDNFRFVGLRTYRSIEDREGGRLEGLFDNGFGILRDPSRGALVDQSNPSAYSHEFRGFVHDPSIIVINKSNVISRVGRQAELDYFAVKFSDSQGDVRGELKVIGLFSADAYTASTKDIPILRQKISAVRDSFGFDPASHKGRTLRRVIEEYPRDELFQLDQEAIAGAVARVMPLYEFPRVRVISRVDRFHRSASVIAFIPRDRYNSEIRRQLGVFLEECYNGTTIEFEPNFPHGAPFARVRFVIRLRSAATFFESEIIERKICSLIETWSDRLRTAIQAGSTLSSDMARKYAEAFDAGYRERYTPAEATADIAQLEQLSLKNRFGFLFFGGDQSDCIGLKVYSFGDAQPLSMRVPILGAMGFLVIDERSYMVRCETVTLWIHDMTLARAGGGKTGFANASELKELLGAVTSGQAENDRYNALILENSFNWREIAILRAISRYLRQVKIPFSHEYMAEVVLRHASIASQIIALFKARLSPDDQGHADEGGILDGIYAALNQVESLDEDRILRRFVNIVQSTVRTNAFQHSSAVSHDSVISFKLDSRRIDQLPEPRPLYEIFVTSPRVEGVHLRFGKVARGGLRWSDRPEDFRTEVLSLVKTQQIKNAVIVPVGAKGGFVPKNLPSPSDRQAWMVEGTEAYRLFVSSLLDITDNIDHGVIIPPDATARRDGDDPYLVVAADKGTATFSDTANAIGLKRKFWLGDAFASGGSAGYDHKKMGITARGAWEAVKRHFREMNIDIQSMPITVIGVGDMSGDVFGNGMLLSKSIKLVAAFDHRDIFLDPTPDLATAWEERRRLFDLPRSSWQDYDKGLLSKGGGVFSRASKNIPLSPEVQSMTGISGEVTTPQELIRAILKLNADLLYFGGIGTYVRASSETDIEVGDRANDSIRIGANELRVKVIGEGANLGMTQRGRIEAALQGTRLNTDAIDNSAGVNTSDYEVNIKVALAPSVISGHLKQKERDELLAAMTDDVAGLVLANNYRQTLALSIAQRRGSKEIVFARELIVHLEGSANLDRELEYIPEEKELNRRLQLGVALTRPELATILAYTKIDLFENLLQSPLIDDEVLQDELLRYFPVKMRERHLAEIERHQLRREIIATQLTNAMIDFCGPTLLTKIGDPTYERAAKAFIVALEIYGIRNILRQIGECDSRIPGEVQLDLYLAVQDFLISRISWLVQNANFEASLKNEMQRFAAGVAAVDELLLDESLSDIQAKLNERKSALQNVGVPEPLAELIAKLADMALAGDAVLVSEQSGSSIPDAAKGLFAIAKQFHTDALKESAGLMPRADIDEATAINTVLENLGETERKLAVVLLQVDPTSNIFDVLNIDAARRDRLGKTFSRAGGAGSTLAQLSVASKALSDCLRGYEATQPVLGQALPSTSLN